MEASSALTKRKAEEMALMPPPPVKRIRRPAKVLDEDDYTSALSDIIARDYFPGLLESHAQQEYLTALESENEIWIEEAGKKLMEATTPGPQKSRRRSARNSRFNTPSVTPRGISSMTPAADTPQGWTGGETPVSVAGSDVSEVATQKPEIDTSTLSLSAFQAKYTSEDNESFNALVDKQNQKKREKHAYLWAPDSKIPSARQIAHRARETKLLAQKAEDEANGKALIPMMTGATADRPAKPDTWTSKKPDNAFMFNVSSVDEDGVQTVAEAREAASKAAPKSVVHSNTRFGPQQFLQDPGPVPASPSLNTSIVARRDAARAAHSETEYSGGETPRVNGYAFVEEDEPENLQQEPSRADGPSYRDLLAGQVGDATPNPFKLSEMRKRENLHHRMVEMQAKKQRLKTSETAKGPNMPGTPGGGNMTPAARKLMERIGRTPVSTSRTGREEMEKMWSPGNTPRRKTGSAVAR